MKIDDLRESQNIDDRRGQNSSNSGLHIGGSGSGLLLQLLFSRTGWKTKIILIGLLLLLGGGSSLTTIFNDNTSRYQSAQITQSDGVTVADTDAKFVSKVLASTEDYWAKTFAEKGMTYQPPTLVFYEGSVRTACGTGQASSGPFYCSGDKTIYLDLSFYQELSSKYGASGDFAMAYVIAHEVGHHVQNELGTMQQYNQRRQSLSETAANKLNVRLELQADYYAGAWANDVQGQGLLDKGDIEEALQAAHAVGDDTLQKEAYGHAVPDSFTHGTSAQRQRWFDRGYDYGDLEHGDTFSIPDSQL